MSAGSKASLKITLLDVDGISGMTLTADRQPAEDEGGRKVTVTLDLGHPAPGGFWATLRTSGGTATYGRTVPSTANPDWSTDVEGRDDLTQQYHGNAPQYGRLVYMRDWGGASKKTITLTIGDDPYVDPGETIVLQATGYGFPGGGLQSNELTLTIKDNDGAAAADDPILMGALPTIARESGTGADSTVRVPVWLSRPATQKVTVRYSTQGDSAGATADVDFTNIPQTDLTFEPGETRKEIEITIKDDTVEDSGEFFWVWFSSNKPTTVVRWHDQSVLGRWVKVTIINDEADLEGLKLWGAPGAGGPYARLDLGAFDGAVSDYAVTVPHGTTHAKLAGIAPQNEPLKLKAGLAGSTLTAVSSGAAGPAVALAVGDTVLVVQSTAPNGERRTYRVTVTREAEVLSSDADLSGLSAEAGADGSWTALDLGAFAAGTTAYAADGAARDDAGAPHGDGGQRRRDAEGGRGLEPVGGGKRHGERRHRARCGRQCAQGRGDRRGRHGEDLRCDGDPRGAGPRSR